MGMSEDDKRNCCLLEIQETEAKYYRTLEDIEKVGVAPPPDATSPWGTAVIRHPPCPLLFTQAVGSGWPVSSWAVSLGPSPTSQPSDLSLAWDVPELVSAAPSCLSWVLSRLPLLIAPG